MNSIKEIQIFRDLVDGYKSTHQEILECITHHEYRQIYLEWHSYGRMLTEAQITQDQIQKLFAAIDANVKAGKNVDAPGSTTPTGSVPKRGILGSINNSWLKFKEKISQSGPVSGFDVAFDKLQGKVLNASGGQKGVVGTALQKYKNFATKYPKMQGAIYAGIAILAGLSGWGLGGAAILAGVRTIDRLLQGDRLSSALWQGFKTGAVSAAAGQFATGTTPDGSGGGSSLGTGSDFGPGETPGSSSYTVQRGDTLSDIAARTNTSVDQLLKANPQITNPDVLSAGQDIKLVGSTGQSVYQGGVGTAADTMNKIGTGQYTDSAISRAAAARAGLREYIDYNRMKKNWEIKRELKLPVVSSVYLTPIGLGKIFETIDKHEKINEGIWDNIKGAIKSGVDTLKSGITKDKLDLFWRKNYKEYSQADSVDVDTVVDFLRRMGVKDSLIKPTFDELNIPFTPVPPEKIEPTFGPTPGPGPKDTEPTPGPTPGPGPTPEPKDTEPTPEPKDTEPTPGPTPEPKDTEPTPGIEQGKEIEFPGSDVKFVYTAQWLTKDGKPASDAATKVLNQLASGTKNADLDTRDLISARRSLYKGTLGMTENKKQKFRSRFLKMDI